MTSVNRLEPDSSNRQDSSTSSAQATAFGQISFINALPVVLPLLEGRVSVPADLVFATPAQLNKMLQQRQIQLGAMSSFYFLEDGGFELFRDISISGSGQVGSVLLFSKDELRQLDGKVVTVPDSSATSIKLMQVLLLEELGIEPVLRLDTSSGSALDADEVRACLLIGDKALDFDNDNSSKRFEKTDLAQWWHRCFELPFVFGVWGARKEWVRENEALFKEISRSLAAARDIGLSAMLDSVIAEAHKRTKLNHERLRSYFLEDLNYEFTEQHAQALALFDRLCKKNSLFLSSSFDKKI
jgi:chorismate dehydratase